MAGSFLPKKSSKKAKTPELAGVGENDGFLLRLSEGKDVSKQRDGAEIQNGYYSSHGHFFTRMKSVHFFHENGFKMFKNTVTDRRVFRVRNMLNLDCRDFI